MTPNHAPASDRADSYVLVRIAPRPPERKRPRRWHKAAALALGVVLAGGTAQWSIAQRRDAPRISVAPTIQAAPASQARLSIEVGPYDSLPSNSFLRLRGFPTSVSLTEGHAIAPGAWAIPLFGLPSLKAIVPAGVSGRADIVITLVGMDGNTLAETRTTLVIAAPTPIEKEPPPEPLRPAVALPPPSTVVPLRKTAPLPPGLSGEARAHAERMFSMGSKHLEQGNISAARMFFQNAADAGMAEAALKLGSTYDPAELPRLGAPTTLAGDTKEARRWYEKARDLGAPEADSRLGRLGGR